MDADATLEGERIRRGTQGGSSMFKREMQEWDSHEPFGYTCYSHLAGEVVSCPEGKWCHQGKQTCLDPLLWFHQHKPREIPRHHPHSVLSFSSLVLLQHSWPAPHAHSFTWRIRLGVNPSPLAWTLTQIQLCLEDGNITNEISVISPFFYETAVTLNGERMLTSAKVPCVTGEKLPPLFKNIVNSFRIRIWKVPVAGRVYNFIFQWGEANCSDMVSLQPSLRYQFSTVCSVICTKNVKKRF